MTVPSGCGSLLVVGHAPGIPALAHALADGSSDAEARALIAYRYPPATLSTLAGECAFVGELRTACLVSAPGSLPSPAEALGSDQPAYVDVARPEHSIHDLIEHT